MGGEAEAHERTRNGNVAKTVLEFAMQYPGQLMHVNTIAQACGLRDSQVRSAIRRMAEDGTTGTWEVALRGGAWVFHPKTPEPTPPKGNWMLVEVVGTLDGDRKLIKAEDGTFAILKPVDL